VSMETGLINLENDIDFAQEEISGITNELIRIKAEFSEAVVAGYKSSRKVSKMHFVFMSKSFNDLLRRLNYLERIVEFRKLQLELIQQKKVENSVKINQLFAKKKELALRVDEKVEESEKLRKDKETYESLIDELKGKERQLAAEIGQREELSDQLEKQIRELIVRESDPLLANGSNDDVNPDFRIKSLPWPVKFGYVSERFGIHKHEDLINITTQNNGINITCNANEKVFPVFEGKVSAIIEVPGMQTTVLLKHGDHYSVYANLQSVNVVGGQQVTPETEIGSVGENADGITEIHFEIWSGTTKLNPELWLIPR